jgi:hypothetical protein
MLLGLFFPTNKIVDSHIISVGNRKALARLGLPDECLWDPRNSFLLYEAFEVKVEHLEVVSPLAISFPLQYVFLDFLAQSKYPNLFCPSLV